MADATTTLVGNLTRDPELKFLDSGSAAVKFGLAVTRKWKDRNGTPQEQTSFFDCSALGSIAENVASSLRKGDRAIVVGTLEQRSWETDGQKRSIIEVKVEACGPDLRWDTVSKNQRAAYSDNYQRNAGPEEAF